ncbi:MAG: hypothetical protein OEM23_05315, partial [Gemmatimonadota bacterium]|nr:hypothetical protein [Gemmatimonadota bacterium]
ARRSSLAGQLVACDVLPAEGYAKDALKAALMDTARSTLSRAEWPRIVKFVERIGLTSALKVARGETDE